MGPASRSPADAAAAVYRDDLAGQVGCVAHEVQDEARDIARRARTLERGIVDDLPLELLGHAALGPHDGPGRDAVDADFGPELACERERRHREPGLRSA